MYISKFLLNRQKIFNSYEIKDAIATYFPAKNSTAGKDFFYRLEWYKIGISVPIIVYSKIKPEMNVLKECQLYENDLITDLSKSEYKFSIFAVPDTFNFTDPVNQFDKVENWLNDKLKDAAQIINVKNGPDNCLCYTKNDKEYRQQTVTLNGTLKVLNSKLLDNIRKKPLGNCPELGCGLLLLKEI